MKGVPMIVQRMLMMPMDDALPSIKTSLNESYGKQSPQLMVFTLKKAPSTQKGTGGRYGR
jgi:hypothetical protein